MRIDPCYISNPAYRKYDVSIIIKWRNGQLRERHSLNCNAIGKLSVSIDGWNACVRIRGIRRGVHREFVELKLGRHSTHIHIDTYHADIERFLARAPAKSASRYVKDKVSPSGRDIFPSFSIVHETLCFRLRRRE